MMKHIAKAPPTVDPLRLSVSWVLDLPLERGLGCLLETSVAPGAQSTPWGITCVGADSDQRPRNGGGLKRVDLGSRPHVLAVIKSSHSWGSGFQNVFCATSVLEVPQMFEFTYVFN